ncbi:MAG: bifunctional diguanylate cyclase/phosphodiesterase [Lachnospiraceae bacterium]|nr:bifunctional diguanylate cyclase/phosphodiesterase [Lachnospiraceae bacterium]
MEKKHRDEGPDPVSFSNIATTLARDYDSIYVIDPENYNYVKYSISGSDNELVVRSSGDDFFSDIPENVEKLVYKDDQESFLNSLRKPVFLKAIKKEKSVIVQYRLMVKGVPRHYAFKAMEGSNGLILIGVLNIDEAMIREKKRQAGEKIYLEITESLASLYEVIYHIDINTGHYTEYSASAGFSKLGLKKDGKDFFKDIKKNLYHVTDQAYVETVLNFLDRDNLIKNLNVKPYISLDYRQILDDKMQDVTLVAFRQKGNPEKIIVAVINLNDHRMSDRQEEIYSNVAHALASRYEVIFQINTDTNEYIQYNADGDNKILENVRTGRDFFVDAKSDIKKIIAPDDRDMLLAEMEKKPLLENLDRYGAITLTYRHLEGDDTRYMSLFAVRPKKDDRHIIIGLIDVDEQLKKQRSLTTQSDSFVDMAMTLAQRFEVIYRVNIETDEYSEYSLNERYTQLKNGKRGVRFFDETGEYMKNEVYPDDYPMISRVMGKDNLIKSLKKTGKECFTYRVMLDGRPQYMMLFVVQPRKDSKHIIIAAANVDAARKRELDLTAFADGMDPANKDLLTNVRNKRAYVYLESELDELIASDEKPEFAVVTCDVNDLKKINDTKGHETGDEYIRKACNMICSIFEHSPVFRIGGDEFAIILRDQDYEKRESLISNLLYEREKSRKNSEVTIAYGISDYDPDKDMRVADVFKRADSARKENKKQFKKGKKLVNSAEPVLLYRDRPERFYSLFEDLVRQMTTQSGSDMRKIEKLLSDIAIMFRLSKGVTTIYKNVDEERKGTGETLCSFDMKVKDVPVCTVRTVSSIMAIVTMTLYMPEDIEPLSEEELGKVKLVMSSVVSFVSRNRMRNIVDRMAFYDDDGYRNYRGYTYYMMEISPEDRAVAYYNLRQFGIINSEYGKKSADLIMKKHYEGLKELIGDRGSVFRLGGDSFLAVFGQEQLDPVTGYLTHADIYLDRSGGRTIPLATRAGIYIIPSGKKMAESGEYVGKAAMAYKTAQDLGDEAVYFYDEKMGSKVMKGDKIRKDFPGAIEREEFKVYYQPKVDINSGEMVGAESLCRWIKNEKLIPPGDFIPVLERTDDICRLDFYMLEHVCMDLRRWLDEGKKCPRISVNFSRRHMADPRFDETITGIVDKYDIPRHLIEIELTETTTDVEFADLKRVVAALQKVGMYTAVDDFGIGYSSLTLIKDIPWNILKVDKSFLPEEGSDKDENEEIMYRYVVHMTKELGIECVTEGVETVEQVRILRENGCDIAQGYLFDRPLPVSEFETRLDDHSYKIYL